MVRETVGYLGFGSENVVRAVWSACLKACSANIRSYLGCSHELLDENLL